MGSIQATEEFEALFGPLGMSSQYGREFDIDQVDSSPTPGRKEYMVANLLEPTGAAQNYTAGTDFWNQRARLLYNATVGQP